MSQTIASWLECAIKTLESSSESPRADAETMLASALGKDRAFFYTWPDFVLDESLLESLQQFLDRRLSGEPVAYILQEKEFWSLMLEVNSSTLIPRPDTETLVEHVLQRNFKDDIKLLDLGTGSGAIAIALASERPSWQVQAVDFDTEAVQLAQRNTQRHGLKNSKIFLSNWFEAVTERFDVIVSNPPYICESDQHLAMGDVRFEPSSALVAKDNGFADITLITSQAKKYLVSGGELVFEHGWQQALEVRNVLSNMGYVDIGGARDLAGHERISWGRCP